jgi:hypothetical protein
MRRVSILVLLIAVISVFVYHDWLSFGVFLTGDWNYFFTEKMLEFGKYVAWESDSLFGEMSIGIWNNVIRMLYSFFGYFEIPWNIAEKFVILWPIVFLLPLSCFFLLKRISKNTVSAFVGSLYFSLNSYFLSIATHGHQFLTGAAIWGIFTLFFLMRMREEMRERWAVLAGMMLAVAGYYDFRFAYIFLGVGVLYFLWEWWGMKGVERGRGRGWIPARGRNDKEARRNDREGRGNDREGRGNDREGDGSRVKPGETEKNVRGLLWLFGVFVLVFVGLNVFWVLPFGAAGAVSENAGVGRDLFGNDYFELEDAMYLSHPFWTGYGVEWFRDHTAPWWLSALGVLAWVGFWVGRRNRTVLFFALLSVIGILVSKQVSEPWGNLYYYLYDHLPGFNAFREASKFYVLVALGYAVGIGALVERILPKSAFENWGRFLRRLAYGNRWGDVGKS